MSKSKTKIAFEESSGNVFADLGFEDAEELQARGMLGFHIVQILKTQNLKQREIADLLGIKQAEVSHLMNGHFSRFSMDKLLDFLKCLDHKFTIEISPHQQGEPYHQVAFS
jgi:predicted XRE-type DNA-binding protein